MVLERLQVDPLLVRGQVNVAPKVGLGDVEHTGHLGLKGTLVAEHLTLVVVHSLRALPCAAVGRVVVKLAPRLGIHEYLPPRRAAFSVTGDSLAGLDPIPVLQHGFPGAVAVLFGDHLGARPDRRARLRVVVEEAADPRVDILPPTRLGKEPGRVAPRSQQVPVELLPVEPLHRVRLRPHDVVLGFVEQRLPFHARLSVHGDPRQIVGQLVPPAVVHVRRLAPHIGACR